MGEEWREIPEYAVDAQQEHSDTILNATKFPQQLFLYDAFDLDNTSVGYSNKEDFVSTILATENLPTYEISLFPSKSVPNNNFQVDAKYIRNITNYNQKEDDVVSLIFSQERPVYHIKQELDVRDKLIFLSTESIYLGGELIDVKVPKDTPIFLLDSYDPIYDENGVFQYAKITLKRVVSYKAKRQAEDGSGVFQYVEFNFYKANIQPQNVKRVRRTWKSKPIYWFKNITDESGTSLPYEYTKNTQGRPFITPFLPKKVGGTQLNFAASWINEIGYWNANFDKITQRVSFWSNSTGIIKANKNGELITVSDTTDAIGAIPLQEYKVLRFATTFISGGDEQRQRLYNLSSPVLDFSSPFNFMGYKLQETFLQYNSTYDMPRPDKQSNAVWKNTKDQSYAYFDVLINYSQQVITQNFAQFFSKIDRNISIGQEYWNTAYDIIKGFANMFGETLNLKPPFSWDKDFDFSPNPKDWDIEEIKKFTGVFWMSSSTSVGMSGAAFPLYNSKIEEKDLPSGSSPNISIGAGTVSTKFGSSSKVKQRLTDRNWYVNYDENWVEEIEFYPNDNNQKVNTITSDDRKYFGGSAYKDEYFQNSYEDCLDKDGNYDPAKEIPCTFTFDNVEYKLPTFVHRAINKRGNPLAYGEKIIWGSGGTRDKKAEQILIEHTKEELKKNPKKIINIRTGKMIKNPLYKKGVKNGR